jgi:ketosteroid isomerase-like protein
MTSDTPETLARALFDALSSGDFSAWETKLAPNFTASYPGLRGAHDRQTARAFNEVFPIAFPDLTFEFTSSARSGDKVFLTWTGTGTHTGPLASPAGTMPPSGRRGSVTGVMVATIRDGKIFREESYWNVPDLIEQLSGPQQAAA